MQSNLHLKRHIGLYNYKVQDSLTTRIAILSSWIFWCAKGGFWEPEQLFTEKLGILIFHF